MWRHTCHFQFILVIYNPFQFRIQVKCFGPLWQRSLQIIASLSLQKRFNCSLWRSKMVLALLRKSPEVRLVSFYQFSNHIHLRLSGNVVPCNSTRTRGVSNALIDKRKRWARGSCGILLDAKGIGLAFFCETGGRNSHNSSRFFRCHWKFRSLHYGCEFINMKISFHWQNECRAKRFIRKALHQTDLSFSAVSSYSNVIKKVTDLKRKIFFKRWKPCWR